MTSFLHRWWRKHRAQPMTILLKRDTPPDPDQTTLHLATQYIDLRRLGYTHDQALGVLTKITNEADHK